MCYQCNQKLPNELIVQQLKDSIENPNFEVWNTTSLSFIILSLQGYNGCEAHELSKILAEMFYQWYLGPSQGMWQNFYQYKPNGSLIQFPHSTEIRSMIDEAIETYERKKDEDNRDSE